MVINYKPMLFTFITQLIKNPYPNYYDISIIQTIDYFASFLNILSYYNFIFVILKYYQSFEVILSI